MNATWDEWLLLCVTAGCLCRVTLLFRRVWFARRWSQTLHGINETTIGQRELIREHFRQEIIRLQIAALFFVAGLIGILTHPPPPHFMFQARWKLWIIITATAMLWRQSERAWMGLTRRTHVREGATGGEPVVSSTDA